ncbi:MAG TPA: baseplate J/gp47 family protein [Drouetiella sp.]
MAPQTKTFKQIVTEAVAQWAVEQGLSPSLVSGDPLLALVQAFASQQMFIQFLCEQVLAYARASTATGADLDSWLADFGFSRLAAAKARGQVSFSTRSAKNSNTLIPAGKQIQVIGGFIQYQVVADPQQVHWDAAQNAYVLPTGQTSVIATVEAVNPGYIFNVQPGQLNQIIGNITNIDNVTNLSAISNGRDAENDVDVRSRFILYINSLSKNTRPAITAAIMSVEQGINFNLLENVDFNGNERDGFFTVVIDDGSGNAPDELLTQVATAVDQVRGFSIAFGVTRATSVSVNVTLNIRVSADATSVQVQSNVENAIVQYINSLKIGQTLFLYDLVELAKTADPAVVAVQVGSLSINNQGNDLTPTGFQVLRTVPANVVAGTF